MTRTTPASHLHSSLGPVLLVACLFIGASHASLAAEEGPLFRNEVDAPGLTPTLSVPELGEPGPKPKRPPGLALLFSLLLPGAGQLYNGDQRGYLYLGIEAGAWFARSSYQDAGNKQEGRYEAFARQHWAYDRFRSTAGEDGCLWTARSDSLVLYFLEHDVQQYYEEIGKLDFYRCGWDDFRETYDPDQADLLSPRRREYRDMRKESNDLLNKSRLALTVAVLNRLVSGIDAFQTARSRRASGEPQSLRLESRLEGDWREPRAVLRLVKELP